MNKKKMNGGMINILGKASGLGLALALLCLAQIAPIAHASAPEIYHPQRDAVATGEDIVFYANVSDPDGVTAVTLYYQGLDDNHLKSLPMVIDEGTNTNGTWKATVPGQSIEGTVFYHINATDGTYNATTFRMGVNVIKPTTGINNLINLSPLQIACLFVAMIILFIGQLYFFKGIRRREEQLEIERDRRMNPEAYADEIEEENPDNYIKPVKDE